MAVTEEGTGLASIFQVILLFVMELCSQALAGYMSVQDPHNFEMRNGMCLLKGGQSAENKAHATEYFTYLLPVLGGLMATIFMSYISVIQLGGFIFLFSAVVMAVAGSMNLLCYSPQLSHFLWALPTISSGIVEPAIVYGICRRHLNWRSPNSLSILFAVLFIFSCLGEHIGIMPWSEFLGLSHPLFGVAFSVLFIIFSLFMQEDSFDIKFELPRRQRILRLAKIFSGLTPFAAVLSNYHWTIYAKEWRLLVGYQQSDWSLSLSPIVARLAAYLATAFITIVLSCYFKLPIVARIYTAITIEMLVSIGLSISTAAAVFIELNKSLVTVWLLASFCDGVACCLATVAVYELFDRLSDESGKPLAAGIMLTMFGVGGFISFLLSQAFEAQTVTDWSSMLFIYHIVCVILLAISLLYHKLISIPLAEVLLVTADEMEY